MFEVSMNGYEVIGLLTRVGAGIRPAILEQLTVVSEIVKKVMQTKAPVGVTGNLQARIDKHVSALLLAAEIKPKEPYADAVETGSKPHWPPFGPGSSLEAWANMHGIKPGALAASIAKKGTKPHPFVKPTYDEVVSEVPEVFAKGMYEFIAEIMR